MQKQNANEHLLGRGGEIGLLSTTGRIGRMQYFRRAFPAAFVSALLINGTQRDTSPIVLVFALLITSFIIPQGVKRLHDLNLSGWWVLVGAIPYLGPLCGIIIIFTRGTRGPNRYGPDPLAAPQSSGNGQQSNALTTE